MRPEPGQVLHFSEDPTITRFRPHVAATAQQPEAYVWAVDAARAPDYWFPRQCPRAMAWAVGDLLALHAEAGIQLRVLPRLGDFWQAVIASTMEFSGIRLRNALTTPPEPPTAG
ncbi:DUF6886 family protein [Symbioplanes lichenis]|uniref:DUF6886 family protein n=1 Tax=Symbioplanes lichenis TaxID=1629072 RepID=UPI0027395978|nr:DUF6886 family protein [Actinoplanes lichenis]